MLSEDYSIRLDVLRALVAERRAWLSESLAAEEAKAMPDADMINALDEERAGLPTWTAYPDEHGIDAEIRHWRAVVERQGVWRGAGPMAGSSGAD